MSYSGLEMITDKNTAKHIIEVMRSMFDDLSASCVFVEQHCSAEEYAAYKKATASIAGGIVTDVLGPVYKQHPDLKPVGWDD